jgi:hypothetical protein
MLKHALEEQLTALTREFVGKLVEAIRNASFAEVAALPAPGTSSAPVSPRPRRRASQATPTGSSAGGGGRQTAARRAEIGHHVVRALANAGGPLGVRALAGEVGLAPDRLAVPLRELRDAGKIRKHGDKRSTTYSLA